MITQVRTTVVALLTAALVLVTGLVALSHPAKAAAASRRCTFTPYSVVAEGWGGQSSTVARRDSCHWYYRARVKCWKGTTPEYKYGVWRTRTTLASIASCTDNNWRLTRAWYQLFRNGHYYQVYP